MHIGFDATKDTHTPMRTATEAARKSAPQTETVSERPVSQALLDQITAWLDEAKAEEVVTIGLKGKSSLGDFMVIATGRTDRHVGAIADQLAQKLRAEGYAGIRVEGQPQCDWVLVDAGDVIVHVFRPEVREFYNLEKLWTPDRTPDVTAH